MSKVIEWLQSANRTSSVEEFVGPLLAENVDHERLLFSATIFRYASGGFVASQLMRNGSSRDPKQKFVALRLCSC